MDEQSAPEMTATPPPTLRWEPGDLCGVYGTYPVVPELDCQGLRVGTDRFSCVDLVLSLVEVLQQVVNLTERLERQ